MIPQKSLNACFYFRTTVDCNQRGFPGVEAHRDVSSLFERNPSPWCILVRSDIRVDTV